MFKRFYKKVSILQIRNSDWKQFNIPWGVLLLVLVLACLLLPLFGVYLEDVQTILFPFVLLALWRLPKNERFRIPGGLVLVSLTLWFVGLLTVRAYYPATFIDSAVYLSRLDNDPKGSLGRALYKRYNEIALTYSLPRMSLLQLGFSKDGEGHEWLNGRGKAVFLIRGSADWLRVLIPDRFSYFESSVVSKDIIPDTLAEEAKKLEVNLDEYTAILNSRQLSLPLVVSTHPGLLNLPGATPELGLHFLAWLAKALGPQEQGLGIEDELTVSTLSLSKERIRAMRMHYLYNASSIDGPWKTLAPRSAALFYIGTLYLTRALREENLDNVILEDGSLDCAIGLFRKAAGYVQRKYNPQTYAAIFNNAAVAQLLRSNNEEQFNKAREWLKKASLVTQENGQPTHAAKLAVLNMLMIERAGL